MVSNKKDYYFSFFVNQNTLSCIISNNIVKLNQFEISHFACFKFSHQTIIKPGTFILIQDNIKMVTKVTHLSVHLITTIV